MKNVFCFIVHNCLIDQSAQPSTGLVPLVLEPMCAFINGLQSEPYHSLWILRPDPSKQKDVVHAAVTGATCNSQRMLLGVLQIVI